MPLIIILVECGIELIPKEIRNHPAIKRNLSSRIFSSQLLDNALHHTAMKNLKNLEKRGRPDIVHLCLLNALGSPLNKTGNLKLYIHTVNNKIFKFDPKIRIARNYNRFKGLMGKLLIDENITIINTELISHFNGTIKDLIHTFKTPEIFLFSSKGKLVLNYQELFLKNLSENLIVIIGGFQKGHFSDDIFKLSKNIISLSKFPLDAWVAVNKIITLYELNYKIQ
ncbi:MAG: 16S rRNA methyltransferase [Promethearchaeota archaeon]